MPYILLKRDDIPSGLLQNLDLQPNTSLRNFPYQLTGQTGYRLAIPNDAVSISGGATVAEVAGLTAWFADNVSSGAGAKATADITTVTFANLASGDYFTVSDGENSVIFEFAKTATWPVTSSRVAISVVGDVTANDVRDTIIAVINGASGFTLNVTAASGGASTVTLTNNNQNQPTADQDATNSENVANVGFAIANFAGAADSDALTAAEAAQDAQDVLDLLGYGDVTAAAGDIDYTAINGAITTGAINREDVTSILDILAGRNYVVPAGTVLETAGEFVGMGGAFDDATIPFRRIYDGSPLRSSFAEGRISHMIADTFTYVGVSGAAVAVYNNDGTLYTG